MARVKRGVTGHAKHKKILATTKGYKLGRKNIFRLAKQAWLKAEQHRYKHRRTNKRDRRRLWIVQLNAAVRQHGLTYSQFIAHLDAAGVPNDRKILSQLSIESPEQFTALVDKVKAVIEKAK